MPAESIKVSIIRLDLNSKKQKRNGLKVDGDIGTARSLTRMKLNLLESQLDKAK